MVEKNSITLSSSKMLFLFVIGIVVLAFVFNGFFFANPFNITILVSVLLIGWAAIYAQSKIHKFGEMCCMMNGMAFGMITSFYIGTLLAIPGGDFILGMIAGTLAGFFIGIFIGRAGGHLGRLEGVMAAPMGGAMGAMTGVMIRVYDLQIFMEFFFLVLVFIIYETTKMNYHTAEKQMPKTMLYTGIAIAFIAVVSVFAMQFSVNDAGTFILGNNNAAAPDSNANSFTAPVVGGVQQIDMRIKALTYEPDYIVVRKGVPVKLNLKADSNAGCTRALVFPDFNARKTVAQGGTDVLEFTPDKTGKFSFRCSMGMAYGTIVVQ